MSEEIEHFEHPAERASDSVLQSLYKATKPIEITETHTHVWGSLNCRYVILVMHDTVPHIRMRSEAIGMN